MLIHLIKFLIMSDAAFSGSPTTVPSSSTPINRSPPNRFRKEQILSYTSFPIPLPQRLNSTATFSPTVSIDSKFLISIQISFQSLAFISDLAISGAKISLPDILLSNHSIIKQEIQVPDCLREYILETKKHPGLQKSNFPIK